MTWLEGLLEPLLDRIALKLALKVRAQLDGAMDRAEERIEVAFDRLEERLLGIAKKAIAEALGPIADVKAAMGPVVQLQQQIEALGPERLQAAAEAAGMTPAEEVNAQIKFMASGASAAAKEQLLFEMGRRLGRPKPPLERPDQ